MSMGWIQGSVLSFEDKDGGLNTIHRPHLLHRIKFAIEPCLALPSHFCWAFSAENPVRSRLYVFALMRLTFSCPLLFLGRSLMESSLFSHMSVFGRLFGAFAFCLGHVLGNMLYMICFLAHCLLYTYFFQFWVLTQEGLFYGSLLSW